MTVGRLTQLILECDDAEQLARFWPGERGEQQVHVDLLVDDLHASVVSVPE